VTWNAPAHLGELLDDERGERPGIGVALIEEIATHRYDNTPAGVARHLVIQGDMGDVVGVEHAAVLHSRAGEPCELVIVSGGDHRLTEPAHRRQAVEASIAWFQRFVATGTVAAREGGIGSR
jgi:hypothetical protein